MNSRSGMSTPVVNRYGNAGVGADAELADVPKRPVNPARDLGDEGVPAPEDVTRPVDELVGVRGVRQVVGGEDQRLGESPRPRARRCRP
jgi:hypothetical protein